MNHSLVFVFAGDNTCFLSGHTKGALSRPHEHPAKLVEFGFFSTRSGGQARFGLHAILGAGGRSVKFQMSLHTFGNHEKP